MESLWDNVDRYFAEHLAPDDAVLEAALTSSAAAGLPPIAVTPTQGKFLELLARLTSANRILEIGTLGGYSTIWMGRALPRDGRLISLEIDANHAAVAKANIARATLSDRVEIVVAPALDTLSRLAKENTKPFDLVFIDADKANIDKYFVASLALSHVGSAIVIDNVVRKGEVVDESSDDANIQGVRRVVDLLSNESRVASTAIQTVGSKGHDGFIIAVVTV
jgi:predicted O-methyltransferase YrrM